MRSAKGNPSSNYPHFKNDPSAQPLLWKWVLFAWEWKIISISKAEHLTSFWYRGPGELVNGFFNLWFASSMWAERSNGFVSTKVRSNFLAGRKFFLGRYVLLNEAQVYFALRQKALIRLGPGHNWILYEQIGDEYSMTCVFVADKELRNLDPG